ncbi:hypothetical protein KVT40_002082 [Elsinoe batatas]|uniref:At2g23090-like zinc-binding domain-containing protein n=1 Tax=Elsinoe batatas TaxID=2601811 RepID=A0A8K0PKC3_9PEZI|nr:hypothetical protein KVT40_002082 [Elsinoe batatas]
MGNGAKAASRRDRKDEGKKDPKSQLKSNAAAQSIKCKVCFQTFQSTTKQAALEQHAKDRHSKTHADCF